MKNKRLVSVIMVATLVAWAFLHVTGIFYGAQEVPLHISYVGDEQSPVNGALHVLEEKSILGLRDTKVLYYGPVFAMLALPAVVGDFVHQCAFERVCSAEGYKNSILWDWGGIVARLHLIGVLCSSLGLYLVYRMFMLKTLNPKRNMWLAFGVASMVGLNYYFFENSNFFINWTFVTVLLIAQLYFGFLIYESQGKKSQYWWAHGLITVLNFGINYFNALYMIAYVPLAYRLWRSNEQGVRKKLYLYTALVALGVLAVLWWHPYAFIRLLGMAGIGSMAGHLNSTFTPMSGQNTSFTYYGKVLLLNHLPIFVALVILGYSIFLKSFKENFVWLWMFGSIALSHFLLFASLTHHEGRYVLVTIVMLLFMTGTAFIQYLDLIARKRTIIIAVSTLLVCYLAFHTVHIGKWIALYHEGPVEQKMIAEVLALQKENPEPVVLVQDYIAGHMHTKEAYQAYITKRGREEVNLYKTIMVAPLSEKISALNVRYVYTHEFQNDPSLIAEYPHAYRYVQQRPEELNQFHFMDENMLRLWFWDEYMPYYVKLK